MSSAVGRRYASALLELAEQGGQTTRVQRDLASVLETWEGNFTLREAMTNPAVSLEQRKEVLKTVAQRLALSPVTTHTLMLLADRQRLVDLPAIAAAFEELAQAQLGAVKAIVTTATALPETYFTKLKAALQQATGKKVEVETQIDPTILGGVITRIGDKVFDGSLKARLAEIEESMLRA